MPYARRMLDLLDGTVADLARDVDAGEHPGSEGTPGMELIALDHIVATSRARGIDPALAEVPRALAAAAVAAGHGADGSSRVVDQLRDRGCDPR